VGQSSPASDINDFEWHQLPRMTSTAWPRLSTNHIGTNTSNLDSYNLSPIDKKHIMMQPSSTATSEETKN
jgi:hypothetical protein